jgi:methylase of polypeptide subunit release factors
VLRTAATDEQLAVLRAALSWLADSPEAFDALFAPAPRRGIIPEPPDPVAAPLYAFELITRDEKGVRGLRRIHRRDKRFYVMELGVGDELEYVHELWPETDALVAELEGLPLSARLCEIGTGTGVIAVEAAARGLKVVATDLYETSLTLARFNARLNGVAVDFRLGHLLEPIAGERYDLILADPHYGGPEDQLRPELLRAAPAHLTDGGRLVLATHLEWQQRGRLAIECVLRPLAADGARVTVRPIRSELKRDWFAVARTEVPIPELVSRHRFTVEIARREPAGIEVEWPATGEAHERTLVPLSRLRRADADAVVAYPDDVFQLGWLCVALAAPTATFNEPLPVGWLDACRYGAQPCVAERGAAAAILDVDGGVRPCTHGERIARAEDTFATVAARLEALAREARTARGCASCPAEPTCSKCLFPFPLEAPAYCDFIRMNQAQLPKVRRLFETVRQLDALQIPQGPLRVAQLERMPPTWPMADAWLLERGGRSLLFWREAGRLRRVEVDSRVAGLLRNAANVG